MKGALIIICSIMIVGVSISLIVKYNSIPKEAVIPIEIEIEKVISESNKIERIFGLWAGFGTDFDSPPIVCHSVEQLVSLVQEGEKIYIFQKIENDNELFKKIYISFLKDNAGIIMYEDKYSHSKEQLAYKIKDYNLQEVIFKKDVRKLYIRVIVFSFLILICFIALFRLLSKD